MTRAFPALSLLIAAGALSGCMRASMMGAPESDVPYNPPISMDAMPVATPVAGTSGLQERQPDLCGAKQYTTALGQPGSMIPSLGVTKAYRVVEFRGIEPQNYDPNRIVFRLDAAGNIQNVDCG